jgi:hypothetical protein
MFSSLGSLGLLNLLGLALQAAPIPGLFGTGVDDSGALLSAGAIDPHYKLITSADTNFPGPNSIVVSNDFPIAGEAGNGPWLTNGPISKWIGPQPDQTCCGQGNAGGNGGNAPGAYAYRISFDLTGFDLSTVKITGQWACDSEGTDIKINGVSTGNKIAPFPPQPSESWHPFTINSGFVDGVNTLDFLINRSSGKYPTGLRADVLGTGLLLPKPVQIAGLFGTGVDNNGILLVAGTVDPHYTLILSADTNFPGPNSIVVSNDFRVHNGWSMDYQGLPPADVLLPVTPDEAVPDLLKAVGGKARKPAAPKGKPEIPALSKDKLVVNDLVRALKTAVGDRDVTLAHISLSWDGTTWPFRHPLDYVGSEGGGGIGGGPGNAVGTALALKGSGRLPVAVCGDGDFMMANTAVWTAAHYKIPLLIVVANNRSFFNDELHQERVARIRSRPVENRWIGQRITEPDIDIASLARSQGAQGFGPVTKTSDLVATFEKAIAAVEAGEVVVVDVRVEPGYSAVTTAAMLRGTEKK